MNGRNTGEMQAVNDTESNRIVWWLLTLLLTLAMGGGAFWATSAAADLKTVRRDLDEYRATSGERMKGLEGDVREIRAGVFRIEEALKKRR